MQLLKPNRINQNIRSKIVRLIGLNGEQIGIINLKEALIKAEDTGFDLVEISPNSKPPVCRIMDYGKFLYAKNKASKEQKKKQKIIHLKEIKFRPGTDIGDYKVKLRNLIRFLKKGDKIKVTLRFRGREMMHTKLGFSMLNRIKNDLNKLATVESFPSKVESRQIIMILIPKK
ncbi:translation initiation factor IF-3 [Enterobacteriaceae endosymbiont of Donacia bicoloricornis]|uniref:translation initiation factor IF-3 n=1 Tax=Enterobacteriaceae endosymbiont of Donacia bicoloricornis TaxID=2675772 RepID=UPI00144918D4|nr:translation initiation factor IF-3 [Enterobacteriaceae endosymbiont of Donacia bicoloricornis]QJC37639.1 translation initiation factor IF-3 [Enterobacteriaceae endosymbiont of Donacia bicoloricornis]